MSDVKRIDIKEFREKGYLQEVNRRFLHRVGLALEVVVDDDGTERLGGIWDYREDPEGICFAEGMINDDKAKFVQEERDKRIDARCEVIKHTTPNGIQLK